MIAGGLLVAETTADLQRDAEEDWADLLGPQPELADVLEASITAATAGHYDRAEALRHGQSREEVAAMLGVTKQAVSAMRRQNRLLALTTGRELVFPDWQFDVQAPSGVLSGIGEVASRFPSGLISLGVWMCSPNPDFDGLTPRRVLLRGELQRVLLALESLTATGW